MLSPAVQLSQVIQIKKIQSMICLAHQNLSGSSCPQYPIFSLGTFVLSVSSDGSRTKEDDFLPEKKLSSNTAAKINKTLVALKILALAFVD